jgi:serine/threonine protein kinase
VEACGVAADIYSLGGVFWAIATGRDLFPHIKQWARLVIAVKTEDPTAPSESPTELPLLGNLAVRMLSREPEARPSIDVVIRELKAMLP